MHIKICVLRLICDGHNFFFCNALFADLGLSSIVWKKNSSHIRSAIWSSEFSYSKSRSTPLRLFIISPLYILNNICMIGPFERRPWWTRHLESGIFELESKKSINENSCIPSLLKMKPQVYEMSVEDASCRYVVRRIKFRLFYLCFQYPTTN